MAKSNYLNEFQVGMYVRVPIDNTEYADDHRDFRSGRIIAIDRIAGTITVALQIHEPGEAAREIEYSVYIDDASRCRLLPDTECIYAPTGQAIMLLQICLPLNDPTQHYDYFAVVNGKVQRVCEADIIAPAHRHDPDPIEQIRRYELHNPIWRIKRDQFMEDYAELKSSTFGIAELVSSRVLLFAHQAEVVTRVLSDSQCRYILADEVGLGKTIEACVILKGLTRRAPNIKVLVITPASLKRQWFYELDKKFWLTLASPLQYTPETSPGILIDGATLQDNDDIWLRISQQKWDLVLVDEAHHVHKQPLLYKRIQHLTRNSPHVLLLSATPIQHETRELLYLLRLVNPHHYENISDGLFKSMIGLQDEIRRTLVYFRDTLTEDFFDPDEFIEEMKRLAVNIRYDVVLPKMIDDLVNSPSVKESLRTARQTLTYLSENYRLENRMIRNRRKFVGEGLLPKRDLNTQYHYLPSSSEKSTLDELHTYLEAFLTEQPSALAAEYCRILLHAAASSPQTLRAILSVRAEILQKQSPEINYDLAKLLQPSTPYSETARITNIMQVLPPIFDEEQYLADVKYALDQWQPDDITSSSRLDAVMNAIADILAEKPKSKVVIFAGWYRTVLTLKELIKKRYGSRAISEFHCGIASDMLQSEANKFQGSPDCHFILCDELGGEGRNFQIADSIIHVDLPWTPAQLEQRIGRVDRLGKSGEVSSIVIYAKGTVEEQLFNLLQDALNIFTQSTSGLEIVLEDILMAIQNALLQDTRNGLDKLLPEMKERAKSLRRTIEEDRVFEAFAIDETRLNDFERIREKYHDGNLLSEMFLSWATLAGLHYEFDQDAQIARFLPGRFNYESMKKAKFFTPPNLETEITRAKRRNTLQIVGTYNRQIAVQQESIIFFAPGSDTWTDTIVANAFEADRGRATAIGFNTSDVEEPVQVFDFLYTIQIDPKPLYERGFHPVHLFHAQGYLVTPSLRLLITPNGERLNYSHPIAQLLRTVRAKDHRIHHLGKRGDGTAAQFRDRYPPEIWHAMLDTAYQSALAFVKEEFSFLEDEAEDAKLIFQRKIDARRAVRQWLNQLGEAAANISEEELIRDEQIYDALSEGIRHPLIRLESVAFWDIQPGKMA